MKHNILTVLVVAACCCHLAACAQSRKTKTKAGKIKPVLVAAVRQGTQLSGQRETAPEYRFILAWNDKLEPTGLFWRGAYDWQLCDVAVIKNYNHKTYGYEMVEPAPRNIKAGDTLELKPASGGKHPIPQEIQQDRENVLYYKTSAGIWKSISVTSIETLPPKEGPSLEMGK